LSKIHSCTDCFFGDFAHWAGPFDYKANTIPTELLVAMVITDTRPPQSIYNVR